MILLARRKLSNGELGGPRSIKVVTSSIFVFFWVTYVLISAMEAYKVIDPGF